MKCGAIIPSFRNKEDDPNYELLTEVDEELLNILLRNEVRIILGIVMRKQEEEKLLEIT